MSRDGGQCGVVILAAGGSARMGRPKQVLPLADGVPLARRAALSALESACRPVVVVVGAEADAVRAVVEDLPVRLVENPDWRQGLSTSVRRGTATLAEDEGLEAAIFAPCDVPLLTGAVLDALAAAHAHTGKPFVVSEYGGVRGSPLLVARELWPLLDTLSGDRGAQKLALERPNEVEAVPFDGGAFDLDTPEDYRRFVTARPPNGGPPAQETS